MMLFDQNSGQNLIDPKAWKVEGFGMVFLVRKGRCLPNFSRMHEEFSSNIITWSFLLFLSELQHNFHDVCKTSAEKVDIESSRKFVDDNGIIQEFWPLSSTSLTKILTVKVPDFNYQVYRNFYTFSK